MPLKSTERAVLAPLAYLSCAVSPAVGGWMSSNSPLKLLDVKVDKALAISHKGKLHHHPSCSFHTSDCQLHLD